MGSEIQQKNQLAEENRLFEGKITLLAQENSVIKQQVSNLEGKLNALDKNKSQIESLKKTDEIEIIELKAQLKARDEFFQTQRTSLEKKLTISENEISALKACIMALESKAADNALHIHRLTEENAKLKEQAQDLTEKHTFSMDELAHKSCLTIQEVI